MPWWKAPMMRGGATCAAFLLAGAAGQGVAVAAEELVPVPETGTPGLLSLSSSVYPLTLPVLEPDESFSWQIGLRMTEPVATSALQVTATGEIAGTDMYVVSVEECAVPWQGTSGLNASLSCPSGSVPRIPPTSLAALRQDVKVPLSDLRAGTAPYLRFSLARPRGSTPSAGTSLTLGIGVSAVGEGETDPLGEPDPPEETDQPGETDPPEDTDQPGETDPPGETGPPDISAGDNSPKDTGVEDTSRADASEGDNSQLGETGASVLPAIFAGGGLLLLGAALLTAMRRPRTPSGSTP